jgi:hypothetical protein
VAGELDSGHIIHCCAEPMAQGCGPKVPELDLTTTGGDGEQRPVGAEGEVVDLPLGPEVAWEGPSRLDVEHLHPTPSVTHR